MTAKRWRVTKAKPGELKAQWGVVEWDRQSPQLVYAWGEGVHKGNSHLLHDALSGKRCVANTKKPGWPHEPGPSFLQELESNGFDLTTLKFSIQKKAPESGAGK